MKKQIALIIGILVFINMVYAQSATTNLDFVSVFDLYCSRTDTESRWYENDVEVRSEEDCYRQGAEPEEVCCPYYQDCEVTDGIGECVVSEYNHCSEIPEDLCDGRNRSSLAIPDLDGIVDLDVRECDNIYDSYGSCYVYLDCDCFWDDVDSICTANYQIEVFNGTDTFYTDDLTIDIQNECESTDDPPLGECEYDITFIDRCDDLGLILKEWIADWTSSGATRPDDCESGTGEAPCRQAMKLVFFTLLNIIIIVVILIVFYYIMDKKRKKRKK